MPRNQFQRMVLTAVRTIGGIYMFGRIMPVWSVVLVEFCFAYFMECAYGSPLSFRLSCKNFDPKTTHPVLFETAIICATVGLTCAAQLLRDSLKMLHWSILPAYSRRSLGSCNQPVAIAIRYTSYIKAKIQYKSSSRTGKYFHISNLFLLIFPFGKVILLI